LTDGFTKARCILHACGYSTYLGGRIDFIFERTQFTTARARTEWKKEWLSNEKDLWRKETEEKAMCTIKKSNLLGEP
jgi:hypothetical protein